MQELGYRWSWQQLRTHWKNLKAKYNKVRSRIITINSFIRCSVFVQCPAVSFFFRQELYEVNKIGAESSAWVYFDEMNAILAHRPRAQVARTGVDSDAVAADRNESNVDEDQSGRN